MSGCFDKTDAAPHKKSEMIPCAHLKADRKSNQKKIFKTQRAHQGCFWVHLKCVRVVLLCLFWGGDNCKPIQEILKMLCYKGEGVVFVVLKSNSGLSPCLWSSVSIQFACFGGILMLFEGCGPQFGCLGSSYGIRIIKIYSNAFLSSLGPLFTSKIHDFALELYFRHIRHIWRSPWRFHLQTKLEHLARGLWLKVDSIIRNYRQASNMRFNSEIILSVWGLTYC